MIQPKERSANFDAKRSGKIGGSDAAAVLGVSPYKTALRLWMEKKGLVNAEDVAAEDAVYWGTRLEPLIAQEYSHRTGLEIDYAPETCVHPDYPWMVCNLDFRVKHIPTRVIGEIKTVGYYAFIKGDWGEEGSDNVPPLYRCQAQHNCAVDGAAQCDMPILIAGQQYRIYRIPRDEEFIRVMVEEERKFHDSLSTDTPPIPLTLDDLKLLFPESTVGYHIDADEQTIMNWALLAQVKLRLGPLKKQAERLEFLIKEKMGEAEAISGNGIVLATWKTDKSGSRRFSMKLPKGEAAEQAAGAAEIAFVRPDSGLGSSEEAR